MVGPSQNSAFQGEGARDALRHSSVVGPDSAGRPMTRRISMIRRWRRGRRIFGAPMLKPISIETASYLESVTLYGTTDGHRVRLRASLTTQLGPILDLFQNP